MKFKNKRLLKNLLSVGVFAFITIMSIGITMVLVGNSITPEPIDGVSPTSQLLAIMAIIIIVMMFTFRNITALVLYILRKFDITDENDRIKIFDEDR